MSISISGDTGISTNAAPWLTGMIMSFGNETAPDGWLACDGSAVSRTTYATLFSKIGTKWGSGDGSSTFNLPDLRGSFLRGSGTHGSETKADGNAFAGPSVGNFEDDQMQGHRHEFKQSQSTPDSTNGGAPQDGHSTNSVTAIESSVADPISDGTNGTPRTGDESRPFNAGVLHCIKT